MALIDTEALKRKIINLAIQGKLTKQLPEDGTAEELYETIQAEKKALVESGKIKKEKHLDDIKDEEIPFELPGNWKWVRFGKIISLQSGQDLTKREYNDEGKGIPYITGASNYDENNMLIINRWTERPKAFAKNGDILLSCKGTVGKLAILKESEIHIARQIMGIRTYAVHIHFVLYFLHSMVNGIKEAQKGLIPGIERKDVLNLICPLPPVAEQKRIVEKVEILFAEIDTIEKLQSQYAADSEILKSKLIDVAIQGKLTEQLPSDGTAEKLYQQIQTEKQAIISACKIKKEKPLKEIEEDEIPFEIPESWKWVRFGELMWNRDSERIPVSLAKRKGMSKIYDYYGASGVIDKVDDFLFDEKLLLLGEDGANLLSRSSDIAFIAEGKYWVNNHAHVLGYYLYDYLEYVMHYINSISLVPYVTGTAQPKLNQENMNKIPIPLPPLTEQKRILETIEELLQYCN